MSRALLGPQHRHPGGHSHTQGCQAALPPLPTKHQGDSREKGQGPHIGQLRFGGEWKEGRLYRNFLEALPITPAYISLARSVSHGHSYPQGGPDRAQWGSVNKKVRKPLETGRGASCGGWSCPPWCWGQELSEPAGGWCVALGSCEPYVMSSRSFPFVALESLIVKAL